MNRFRFVADHQRRYGVKRLCRVLELSRSGFYRWANAASARVARADSDARLAARIRRIHTESDKTYGSPRVTAELRDAGLRINHKRVERVMRAHRIIGLHLRRRHHTTIADPAAATVGDLVHRDFTADTPNHKYVGDIT